MNYSRGEFEIIQASTMYVEPRPSLVASQQPAGPTHPYQEEVASQGTRHPGGQDNRCLQPGKQRKLKNNKHTYHARTSRMISIGGKTSYSTTTTVRPTTISFTHQSGSSHQELQICSIRTAGRLMILFQLAGNNHTNRMAGRLMIPFQQAGNDHTDRMAGRLMIPFQLAVQQTQPQQVFRAKFDPGSITDVRNTQDKPEKGVSDLAHNKHIKTGPCTAVSEKSVQQSPYLNGHLTHHHQGLTRV